MSDELNNEIWMMRSARLDKPSEVQKLLREGFEPFWGTTVIVEKNGEKEKAIKMYFRKPPVFVTTAEIQELSHEMSEVKLNPVEINLEPFVQWGEALVSSVERLVARQEKSFAQMTTAKDITIKYPDALKDLPEKEEKDEPVEKGNTPEGEGFRVVDDVPQIPTIERTSSQEETITALKAKGNITMLPGRSVDGSVRLMIGADLYTVESDGNFTVENTGAGTDSISV